AQDRCHPDMAGDARRRALDHAPLHGPILAFLHAGRPLAQTTRVRALVLLAAVGCGGESVVYQGLDPSSADPPPTSLAGRIVATDNGDDTLAVFDPTAGALVAKVPVGFIPVELEGPHHVPADPGGRFVYLNLSEAVAGSGTGPHGAHGTGTQPGYTLKLATDTGRLVGRTRVDPNPGDLTLSADGATIYVTHYDLIKWTRG